MFHHHSHWIDLAGFVVLIVLAGAAFSILLGPRSTAQAAESFAYLFQGLELLWGRL